MDGRLIGAVLIGAAVVLGGMSVNGFLKERNAGSTYEALQEEVAAEEPQTAEAPAEPEEQTEPAVQEIPEEEEVVIPVDFVKLQEECPDAYAWIRIPDTKIDYPIVQSPTDNAFYLDHNVYGNYEFAGAIFTEDYNSKDFTDPNTIIYGHNMKNGSMFQNLHFYEDRTFMEEHPTFEIYLPDKILTYRVFAAYNYDDRHLMKAFDFDDSEQFRLYLQEIRNQRSMSANLDNDVEVDQFDKIVTLSTCNGIDDQRYLVQGVLLSE